MLPDSHRVIIQIGTDCDDWHLHDAISKKIEEPVYHNGYFKALIYWHDSFMLGDSLLQR